MDSLFTMPIFTIFLVSSCGSASSEQYKTSQSRLFPNNGNHKEDIRLPRIKRSIDLNPLLIYRCSLPLGLESGQVPDAAFSASSMAGSKNGPERARLNGQSPGGWVAKANNGSQWLQIDLGELVRVTKVATQGRRDADHWVTQFSLSYSLDETHWAEYKENSVTWIFLANKDRNTIVKHLLQTEFYARLVRFHPKAWNERVAMRAEVYGCRNDLS
ncbi:lactadherin-like [Porites lutea]|uniref:lactadherin-like n=1 Tax=Porites lutea TaxID=51062 RepID=UPI003CC54287